jgi:hypothetical protein
MVQDQTSALIRALQRFVNDSAAPHTHLICLFVRLNPFCVKAYLEVIFSSSNHAASDKNTKSRIESLWSGLVTHPLVIDSFQKYHNQVPSRKGPSSSKALVPLPSSSTSSSSLKAVSSRRKVDAGKEQEQMRSDNSIGREIIPNDQEKLSLLVRDRTIAARVKSLREE